MNCYTSRLDSCIDYARWNLMSFDIQSPLKDAWWTQSATGNTCRRVFFCYTCSIFQAGELLHLNLMLISVLLGKILDALTKSLNLCRYRALSPPTGKAAGWIGDETKERAEGREGGREGGMRWRKEGWDEKGEEGLKNGTRGVCVCVCVCVCVWIEEKIRQEGNCNLNWRLWQKWPQDLQILNSLGKIPFFKNKYHKGSWE